MHPATRGVLDLLAGRSTDGYAVRTRGLRYLVVAHGVQDLEDLPATAS
jgi:hypothetical protein